jgi:hypothetical protein
VPSVSVKPRAPRIARGGEVTAGTVVSQLPRNDRELLDRETDNAREIYAEEGNLHIAAECPPEHPVWPAAGTAG